MPRREPLTAGLITSRTDISYKKQSSGMQRKQQHRCPLQLWSGMKDTKLPGGKIRRFILQAAAALLIAASIRPAQISCAVPGSGDPDSMVLYASSEKKKDSSKDASSEKKKETSRDTSSEKKKEAAGDTSSEKKKEASGDTASEKKKEAARDTGTAETAGTVEAAAPAEVPAESATGQAAESAAEFATEQAAESAEEPASGNPEEEPAAESGEDAVQEEAGASTTQTEPAADGEEKEAGKDDGTEASQAHILTELELGRQYLKYLDERTAAEMQVRVDEARAAFQLVKKKRAYAVERDAYREKLSGDKVWSGFQDYVFLGDSRVVGFNVYGFLDSDRILADAGDTILAIDDRIDSMQELSPRYIFISYGINDVNLGLWPTAQEYARDFGARIDELKKSFPEAEIYVNSILPATDDAIEQHPLWGDLPEYSEAVRQMCEQKKICFIDNASIVEDHKDLYAMDGVHIDPDFYRYWAENQLLAIYDLKHGFLSF